MSITKKQFHGLLAFMVKQEARLLAVTRILSADHEDIRDFLLQEGTADLAISHKLQQVIDELGIKS